MWEGVVPRGCGLKARLSWCDWILVCVGVRATFDALKLSQNPTSWVCQKGHQILAKAAPPPQEHIAGPTANHVHEHFHILVRADSMHRYGRSDSIFVTVKCFGMDVWSNVCPIELGSSRMRHHFVVCKRKPCGYKTRYWYELVQQAGPIKMVSCFTPYRYLLQSLQKSHKYGDKWSCNMHPALKELKLSKF